MEFSGAWRFGRSGTAVLCKLCVSASDSTISAAWVEMISVGTLLAKLYFILGICFLRSQIFTNEKQSEEGKLRPWTFGN